MKFTIKSKPAEAKTPAAAKKTAAPAKQQSDRAHRMSDKEIAMVWLLGKLDTLIKETEHPTETDMDAMRAIAGSRRLAEHHIESIGRHARHKVERWSQPVAHIVTKRGLLK